MSSSRSSRLALRLNSGSSATVCMRRSISQWISYRQGSKASMSHVPTKPNAAVQPERVLRAIGWNRLFGVVRRCSAIRAETAAGEARTFPRMNELMYTLERSE